MTPTGAPILGDSREVVGAIPQYGERLFCQGRDDELILRARRQLPTGLWINNLEEEVIFGDV